MRTVSSGVREWDRPYSPSTLLLEAEALAFDADGDGTTDFTPTVRSGHYSLGRATTLALTQILNTDEGCQFTRNEWINETVRRALPPARLSVPGITAPARTGARRGRRRGTGMACR